MRLLALKLEPQVRICEESGWKTTLSKIVWANTAPTRTSLSHRDRAVHSTGQRRASLL